MMPSRLPIHCLLIVCLGFAGVPASVSAESAAPRDITFADLRFNTEEPKLVTMEGSPDQIPSFNDQIPAEVQALSGKRVRVEGYMMPTLLEGKQVREFLVVTSPAVCCYGATPDINEYIIVRMSGDPAPLLENVPLKFEGVLRVGDIYNNGYWTGIYELACESVSKQPKDQGTGEGEQESGQNRPST
ncbi:MAG: DUF3299 domain-containing protein [Opitutaceae bacterium]